MNLTSILCRSCKPKYSFTTDLSLYLSGSVGHFIMQYLPLIVAVVAATLSIASPAKTTCHDDKWKVGQTVKTSSGHVQGHAASNATEVSEYLGIPYSFPPIGHRRFQPPMRYHGHEIINGTNFVSRREICETC